MKVIYGAHQPRYVSDTNVTHYFNKINLQGDIYRLKDYSEENISKYKYRYLGKRLPETLIFNSMGLITKIDLNCGSDLYSNANLTIGAIDSLETGEQSFQDFIADSYVIGSLEENDMSTYNTPIYVIKFAEFVGKLNKDHIPKQIEILKNRNDVKFIFLNMDYSIAE